MATLVQSSPARPLPQQYPIVRPSSSSAIPQTHHSQRAQPLYLVSAQQQMYLQQQQSSMMAANYDFTRSAQQSSKSSQQRRQSSLPQQPNSAPPHPKSQTIPGRSRSDEAMREKSQSQSMQHGVTMTTAPQAQSAPRPLSTQAPAFRPGTALTPPPQVLGGQPRPSSADGGRPVSSLGSYRGRVYPEQQVRYSSGSVVARENVAMYQPPPIQNHPARYSAEDVSTLKNIGYQQYPHGHYPVQQYPIQQYHPPRSASLHHVQHQQPQPKPLLQPMIPGQMPAKPQPQQPLTGQIPIQRRQSSLMSNPVQRPPRLLSPPPQIKRASSSPELAPPHSPLHRKSSSSSSDHSSASAPSQLETSSTSSTHSSIPPQQEQHTPFQPSPLGKAREETPVVLELPVDVQSVDLAPPGVKGKSFSSRLRRALSFSSSSRLHASTSTPDLHAAAQADAAIDLTDTISISSTASSASVMLRKMSSGLKKSRKSIVGIFKGARPRRGEGEEEENKFPFGVPGEEASVAVSHVTVEGQVIRPSEERRKSTVFSERETTKKEKKGKGKPKVEVVNLRGILKRITPHDYDVNIDSDSRQSSFESVPNTSSESIVSVKPVNPAGTLISTPPLSDFAVSLSKTLDAEFEEMSAPPTPTNTYFDMTPSTPPVQRQVVTAPATPTGRTTPRRGIQFSPRLEVHETWHSAEYDRRGELATCNRLTAQLAQMIKEELNAYKMDEMVVHEVCPIPEEVNRRRVDRLPTSFDGGEWGIYVIWLHVHGHWCIGEESATSLIS